MATITPEQFAQEFHEAQQRLAPAHLGEGQPPAVPWADLDPRQKGLLIAACAAMRAKLEAAQEEGVDKLVQRRLEASRRGFSEALTAPLQAKLTAFRATVQEHLVALQAQSADQVKATTLKLEALLRPEGR